MRKFYFALFCALMAATSAIAAPQSGDRIIAAQALAVEWNDAAFRPTVDEATINVGLNAQLTPSENENVLILSGLCGMFNIPVHVDYATGKAWIETGMPLDAYTDQYNRDVVKTIYAVPEQWLADAEADVNANLCGSILVDGSIAFDGGIVFLVSESAAVQDLAAAGEATWMSSPLLRDMRLLVPNAIHQFTLVNEPVELEVIAPAESSSSTQLELGGEASKNVDPTVASVERVMNKGKVVIECGRKPKPKDPGGASTCGVIDNLAVVSVDAPSGGGVIAYPPFNPGEMLHPFEVIVSDGRKPIKPREVKPCGGVDGNEVAFLHPENGNVVRSPQSNGNENPNDAYDLTAGKKNDLRDPNNPKPCSDPWIVVVKMVNERLPERSDPSSSVASSKPADEQFSVPVYVFQNPDDNSIMVYNLYGSGRVMDLSDCQVTPESITWGMTIPYLLDGDMTCYFDTNVLTLTDGTQFTVPAAVVKGDLSNDGKVNIADVTGLIDLLLTTGNDATIDMSKVVADVNEDGKINITDTTILIDMLLHNAQ